MRRQFATCLATCWLQGATTIAAAAEPRTLEELFTGWGVDLDTVEVGVETLSPGLHVLRAAGGAVLASIGDDGVLIVDDQIPQTIPKLERKIGELGGGAVDFVINTHWHFDHADGNPLLGAAGARIIAHANSRRQMQEMTRVMYTETYYDQPPYPAEGLPVLTFDRSMTVHFNGQAIDLAYFGPGHTTGDAAVFFRGSNVVHVGDLFNARYPYIDAGNGGTLEGLIRVCRAIAGEIDAGTRIVSGHAPVTDRAAFERYIDMLEKSYEQIARLKESGKTLEEVLAARPTASYDSEWGNPTLFITMAYQSIAD